jgi:hypothetical protein
MVPEDEPGLIETLPAPSGQPCTWCDCRVPDPRQAPGGAVLFAGHDEDSCGGCPRAAVFLVCLRVPFLSRTYEMPVCTVHRGDAEADLSRQFPGSSR